MLKKQFKDPKYFHYALKSLVFKRIINFRSAFDNSLQFVDNFEVLFIANLFDGVVFKGNRQLLKPWIMTNGMNIVNIQDRNKTKDDL